MQDVVDREIRLDHLTDCYESGTADFVVGVSYGPSVD